MDFRLDMLVQGVYIVSAQYDKKLWGLSATWLTQVARDQIMVCIAARSTTRNAILSSQAFGVSMLSQKQLNIAQSFGSKHSSVVNKFSGIPYHILQTGSPLLDDSLATFDCKVIATYDHENKKFIVGRIVAAEFSILKPELFIYKEDDYQET